MQSAGRAHPESTSLAARFALAIGATLAFLALMELGARGLERLWPPAPDLLEAHRPKRTALPPPERGAYRIYLYGGSTVAGAPTPELSFVAQLRFWLERLAPERPFRIVNLGVNGRPSGFVRKEVERSLASPPDLAIVLTAHNEFLGWKPDGRWEELRQDLGRVLEETALARTLRRAGRRISHALPGDIPIRRPLWIRSEERRGERFRARVEAYEDNTRAVVERMRAAGVPLILATGPANLADWPPVHRFTHDEAFERRLETLRRRIASGALEGAEAERAELAVAYPDDAMLTFLEGRIAAARGRDDAASRLFDAARDADPIPWRVLGRFNDHLRRLSEGPGVHLADLDRAFRREADRGLVGFEWIADNCHPTPLGGALVARELLRVMAREGLLLRDLEGLPPLPRQWAAFRDAALEARADLWLEYLLTNAVYVMKWPFYHFEAARDYLDRAEALAPRDWRIAANRGTVLVLEGRVEEGRRELERAAVLRGEPLRENDRGPTPYLREATAILDHEIEAFVPSEPPPEAPAEAG